MSPVRRVLFCNRSVRRIVSAHLLRLPFQLQQESVVVALEEAVLDGLVALELGFGVLLGHEGRDGVAGVGRRLAHLRRISNRSSAAPVEAM